MELFLPLGATSTALTGALVAGLAFILATVRDEWVRQRDARIQDRNVVQAIREEIEINQTTVASHMELVDQEIVLIENGQRLVNPLDLLASDFWEIVKFNPPASLPLRTLTMARDVARLTVQVNEILRSRELFRVSSPLLTMDAVGADGAIVPAWAAPLRGYDELLQKVFDQLAGAMRNLAPALGLTPMPERGTEASSPTDGNALAGFAGAAAAAAGPPSPVPTKAPGAGALAAFASLAAADSATVTRPENVPARPAAADILPPPRESAGFTPSADVTPTPLNPKPLAAPPRAAAAATMRSGPPTADTPSTTSTRRAQLPPRPAAADILPPPLEPKRIEEPEPIPTTPALSPVRSFSAPAAMPGRPAGPPIVELPPRRAEPVPVERVPLPPAPKLPPVVRPAGPTEGRSLRETELTSAAIRAANDPEVPRPVPSTLSRPEGTAGR